MCRLTTCTGGGLSVIGQALTFLLTKVRSESEKKLSIIVYSKPRCPQCVATCRKLDGLGAQYESVDASEALSFIRGLGYSQAPVVVVKDAEGAVVRHWSGFRPDLIKKEVGK